METSNPVVPEAKALAKPKVISLRFNPNDEYDQATLHALDNARIESQLACECSRRSLHNKAGYFLSMVLGTRPYTMEAFDFVLDVMKTQRERFPRDSDKKPSHEPTSVEGPLIKQGLRLVK